jgi:hypothetical protein
MRAGGDGLGAEMIAYFSAVFCETVGGRGTDAGIGVGFFKTAGSMTILRFLLLRPTGFEGIAMLALTDGKTGDGCAAADDDSLPMVQVIGD